MRPCPCTASRSSLRARPRLTSAASSRSTWAVHKRHSRCVPRERGPAAARLAARSSRLTSAESGRQGGRFFFIYFLSKASFIQFAVLFHLLGGFEDVDHLFQINGTRQPFRTDSRFKRASASSQKICRLPLPLLQLPHSRTPALPLPLSFPLQPRTRVRVSAAFLSLSLALGSAARLDRENFS